MGDRCQTSGKVVEPELVFVVQELVGDEAVEADVAVVGKDPKKFTLQREALVDL